MFNCPTSLLIIILSSSPQNGHLYNVQTSNLGIWPVFPFRTVFPIFQGILWPPSCGLTLVLLRLYLDVLCFLVHCNQSLLFFVFFPPFYFLPGYFWYSESYEFYTRIMYPAMSSFLCFCYSPFCSQWHLQTLPYFLF